MYFSPRAVTLESRRPSPTTVLYTVSNAARRTGLAAKALAHLQSVVRILIFLCSVTHLYAQLRLALVPPHTHPLASPGFSSLDHLLARHTPAFALALRANEFAATATGGVPLDVVLALALAWCCSRRDHLEESLLLIRGLGIQTSSASRYYWFSPTTRFIPTPQMQDIFIHEAFKGFEVRFYLAVVVEGEEEAVVVFPNLLPKRQILEEVWRGAKACLYEPTKAS